MIYFIYDNDDNNSNKIHAVIFPSKVGKLTYYTTISKS